MKENYDDVNSTENQKKKDFWKQKKRNNFQNGIYNHNSRYFLHIISITKQNQFFKGKKNIKSKKYFLKILRQISHKIL